MQKILRIDPKDNLIVALRDLAQGDIIENEGQRIQLVTDVPAKHKFTREPVPVGGIVTLYGVPVGKAVAPLQSGERITVDNVVHYAAEVDLSDAVPYMWKAPDVSRWANRTFDGVIRPDGRVGTANYWLIIPLVFCENRNALKLRDALERTPDRHALRLQFPERPVGRRLPDRPGHHYHERVRLRSAIRPDLL